MLASVPAFRIVSVVLRAVELEWPVAAIGMHVSATAETRESGLFLSAHENPRIRA